MEEQFRKLLAASKHLVVLTGAGVSAESGIPTFRGAGGLWRKFDATKLATLKAFQKDPSLVWEFYQYRRDLVSKCKPNPAHFALAELQKRFEESGRKFTLLTQNVDGLHIAAGSRDVVELHRSLWKTRCLKCGKIELNTTNPICPALEGKGAPDLENAPTIPEDQLPRCSDCQGLLRPYVVWFNENLDEVILARAGSALEDCDLMMVVGTSAVVWPAAGFAGRCAARGVPVAEFNIEKSPITETCQFAFEGPAGKTLPDLL